MEAGWANIQIGRLAQTTFAQIVVVAVEVNKQEDPAHFVPIDNLQKSLLLHQQLLNFPNKSVDSMAAG